MVLTKSDFEKYGVNEVLARRIDDHWTFSYLEPCKAECRRYEESGDQTGVELFSLLISIASMMLDSKFADPRAPFVPMWQTETERTHLPGDFKENQLDFLAEIVCCVHEIVLKAQIADTLWLRRYGPKNGYEFAIAAHDSYMASVKLDSLNNNMEERLTRAMQIADILKDREKLDRSLTIARDIAEASLASNEITSWSRMIGLLGTYSEDNRDSFAERIWQQATVVEEQGKQELSIQLRVQAIDLFRKIDNSKRSKEAQLELVEILTDYAKQEASIGDFWTAQSLIDRSISHYLTATGKRQPPDELQALFSEYGKKANEKMNRQKISIELSEEDQRFYEAVAESVAQEFAGKSLEEALALLALIPYPIIAEKIRSDAEKSFKESSIPHLADFQLINHAGKVVSREWPFAAGWIATECRKFHVASKVQPAIAQIAIELDTQQVEKHGEYIGRLANLLKRSHFVPPHLWWTFAYGLLAGIKFDFVAVAHVCPPMLESAFREILSSLGINTSRWIDQVQEEKSLGWMLCHPAIEERLGPDLLFDLKTLLLKHEGGFNLRNGVAHGLLSDGNFFATEGKENSRELAQVMYLWWIALKLCFLYKKTEHKE